MVVILFANCLGQYTLHQISNPDNSNQAGIKALLKDPEFPNTRGFTFSAFLDGFILGVNLVSGIPKSLFSAILKAIKTGVKVNNKNLVSPIIY